MNIKRRVVSVLCAFLIAGFSQAALADEGIGQDGVAGHLKVMTQNLYVGADLFQILEGEPEDVPFIAASIFGQIRDTNFWERAEAIADQVAEQQPHLIGLQEVSLVRTQCPDDIVFPPYNPLPNATDVHADYLQILMDALAARGLFYEVAAIVTDTDVELPVANLGLLADCAYPLFDARLTDRDVVLKRSDVSVTFSYSDNYLANLPVPTAAGPVVFVRGYNIVDVVVSSRNYRFVNTHLEVNENEFANGFQFAQAYELTQVLQGLGTALSDKVLVVVGDFNSDPSDGPLVSCMLPPTFDTLGMCLTPYAVMASAGYTDTWTVRNGAPGDGYTCCQDALLANDESQLEWRFDFVWVHEPFGGAEGPAFLRGVHSTVVGDELDDRTASWLWPSDHAGIAASMTIRQAK
jgi:hypothetical protein